MGSEPGRRAPAPCRGRRPGVGDPRDVCEFNGYTKTSSWIPVQVVVANEGHGIEGTVRVASADGSGMVECADKQYKARFAGPGMRWSHLSTEKFLPVCSALLSEHFDPTW